MKVLIPMAGEGMRFQQAGYSTNKAILPMIYRKTGERCPMVVCSVKDLPGIQQDGGNVAFIMRDFQLEKGVDEEIRHWYPASSFFSVRGLTEGQACTCLIAHEFINDDEELLIAACDNGIEFDRRSFEEQKTGSDVLVFTYRHDARVSDAPDSFGWVLTDGGSRITGVSVKKHISDEPENDHAIVATFWFKRGKIFVEATEKMIRENDRVNNEFYVDQVIKHVLELGYSASVFEVDRFLNYGTPTDYENYNRMIEHFRSFLTEDQCFGGVC